MKRPNVERENNYISYVASRTTTLSYLNRSIIVFVLGLSLVQHTPVPHLLVFALIADLCQYLLASSLWMWHAFKINNNPKHEAYWWTNFPGNVCFYAKVLLVFAYLVSL